jgi:F-type H+-transporting ATPase subunit b
VLLGGALLLAPLPAFAAGTDWRPVYDIVLMWVNFLILAAVLVKVLRRPLGRFLHERRTAYKETLEALESDKRRIEQQIHALHETLQERKRNAAALHERIVARGRAERQEIVADAQDEADRRLEKARLHIEARQREVWQKLRHEMIDAAVRRAMAELPQHITPELEQDLVDRYLRSIANPRRRPS